MEAVCTSEMSQTFTRLHGVKSQNVIGFIVIKCVLSFTSVGFVLYRGDCHVNTNVFEQNAAPVIDPEDGGKILLRNNGTNLPD
jgi:hypothetical protein